MPHTSTKYLSTCQSSLVNSCSLENVQSRTFNRSHLSDTLSTSLYRIQTTIAQIFDKGAFGRYELNLNHAKICLNLASARLRPAAATCQWCALGISVGAGTVSISIGVGVGASGSAVSIGVSASTVSISISAGAVGIGIGIGTSASASAVSIGAGAGAGAVGIGVGAGTVSIDVGIVMQHQGWGVA
jgi:hypothetical protein